MSNLPILETHFEGAQRITPKDGSEGGTPLFELLNEVAAEVAAATAMTGALDLSAADADAVKAAGRGIYTNTGAARTFTLPTFADAPDGWSVTLLSFDGTTNTFTIARDGTDTINGAAADVLLDADGNWARVFKVAGQTGYLMIGGTNP